MCHIIVLMQTTEYWGSRTYLEFESINECMDSLCRIYDGHVRCQNLDVDSQNYLLDLFNFLDDLADISCVVLQDGSNMYTARNKLWIKEQLFIRHTQCESDYSDY